MATYTKETALYDTAAIAGDIGDAATKATNYLSADSSGIMVYDGSSGAQTPSSPSASTNNVFIDSNSLDIRKGTEVLATFGSDVVIGKENYGHVEINDEGLVVRGNDDGSPITSGDVTNSQISSRLVAIGTGGELAELDMGASRSKIWSAYHSYDNDSGHSTDFITNTVGAVYTANSARTTISAQSQAQERGASVTAEIYDNTNESYVSIVADHINWNLHEIPMVIEQGTSSGWTYRKWSDGTAECWQLMAQKNYAMTNSYGTAYYAAMNPFCTFPSGLFTSAPSLQITRTNTSNGAGLVSVSVSAMTQTSANAYVFSTQSQTLSVGFSLYAVGKWK